MITNLFKSLFFNISMTIEITFLGTGSSVPTARRNHPAVLMKYKGEMMLFDCGEGTQRQFRKAKLNPCKLTKLFITHWHGDHILGIPGLLQTLMLNGYTRTLEVYGPSGTKKFMNRILGIFIHRGKIKIKIKEARAGKVLETKDFKIMAESLKHGAPCLAYSFIEKDVLRIDRKKLGKLKIAKNSPKLGQLKKGRDVVINGKKVRAKGLTYLQKGKKVAIVLDTKFYSGIAKFAKDSDLLICESTYINETALAEDYKHLTAVQASEIAKKAKVDKLILMHLSQRYEGASNEVLKVAKKVFKNSVVAKDLDVVEV